MTGKGLSGWELTNDWNRNLDRRDYIGQIVDAKFKLVELLGEGGMAAVYLAEHVLLHKKVALKVLRADQIKDETSLKRFYREAQASTAIGHPAIINIFDVGHAPWGEPYLVMEYLRGESLGTLIERGGALSLAEAAAILSPLLEALGAAHRAGIIHRDLKPENVFLARNPSGGVDVKIIDFGVSKFTRQAGDYTQLTQLGSVVGTPHYMPLEQLLGQEIDHRADVYATGVVLYEMLTGRRPFEAPSYTAVLGRIMSQQMTPPTEANPAFPRQAESVIVRAMARDPKDRYPNAAAMLTAVSSIASNHLRVVGARTMATRVSDGFVGLGTLGRPQKHMAVSQETLDVLIDTAQPSISQKGRAPVKEPTSRVNKGTMIDAWAKSDTFVRPRKRTAFWVTGVLGGSLILAAAIIAAALLIKGKGPMPRHHVPARPPPMASSPPLAPQSQASVAAQAPRPESIQIHLLEVPVGARIFFDGGLVANNPFRVRWRESAVLLRVMADGFNTFELSVIPHQDLTIIAQLTRKSPPRSHSVVSRQKRRSGSNAISTDNASEPEPTPPPSEPAAPEEIDYRLKE